MIEPNEINDGRPLIFTTGTFLSPKKITKDDGTTWWGWIVEELIEGCYYDGKPYNPLEWAYTKSELIVDRFVDDDKDNKEIK